MLVPNALCVRWVLTTNLYIRTIPVYLSHMFLICNNISRIACSWIRCNKANHISKLVLRIVVMSIFNCHCRCNKLVMKSLKSLLWLVGHLIYRPTEAFNSTSRKHCTKWHCSSIDFIKSKPILYLSLVSCKDSFAIVHEVFY